MIRKLRPIRFYPDKTERVCEMNADKTLDVISQSCPMPLLKTKKQLKNMEEGQTLKVLATDPGYYGDIDKFCKSGMAELVKYDNNDGLYVFYIKKI